MSAFGADQPSVRLVSELVRARSDTTVIEMGIPVWRPDTATYIATYGAALANAQAAVELLTRGPVSRRSEAEAENTAAGANLPALLLCGGSRPGRSRPVSTPFRAASPPERSGGRDIDSVGWH